MEFAESWKCGYDGVLFGVLFGVQYWGCRIGLNSKNGFNADFKKILEERKNAYDMCKTYNVNDANSDMEINELYNVHVQIKVSAGEEIDKHEQEGLIHRRTQLNGHIEFAKGKAISNA